jgi:hypothetical protein
MTLDDTAGLPEADTPAEVLGTIHYVLHALGRELGERYDAALSPIDPNWVQALGRIRHQTINLYDPHFTLVEPLRHPDSPTRTCLPTGGAFYNLLDDTLRVRNAWSHHEISTLDLATLKSSVAIIHELATAAEMRLGALCSHIKKRINAIAAGTYPPAGTAPATVEQDLDALLSELEQARAREAALVEEVNAAGVLLEEAADAGQALDAKEAELATIHERLRQALADKEQLEFMVEGLAENAAKPEPVDDQPGTSWVDVSPGHLWPVDVPTRRLTFMTLQPDLFDETTRSRASEEFGPDCHTTIAQWKTQLPPNTVIFLTPAGQAVTYVRGSAIYLGSLTPPPEQAPPSSLGGFFVPHTYTLRISGAVEDRESDDTLAAVNPAHAASVGGRLLTAAPMGGRLRVTTDGQVARSTRGGWSTIATVTADEWFPGHLR